MGPTLKKIYEKQNEADGTDRRAWEERDGFLNFFFFIRLFLRFTEI